MITFWFSEDKEYYRPVWLGAMTLSLNDEENSLEIYEQLDAEVAFNL